MLECNRAMKKKMTLITRIVALLVPIVCVVLLLTQTAFAKTTYLINDGGRVVLHSTYETDPAEILVEAGLELGEDDTYTTQAGLGMSEITVQRKQTVTIIHADKTLQAVSYGETVESLLNRLGIKLTAEDVLSEPEDATTYDGMVLTISRALRTEETYTTLIPHDTVYCYDSSLAEGEEKVLTEGMDGQLLCTASVFYVDGVEINRTILTQDVVQQPVDQVVAVGTYVDIPEPETMPTEPPTTAAPPTTVPETTVPPTTEKKPTEPRPEATGQPVTSDGVIITPDGEVLTYTDTMQAVATAYTNTDPGCTIWTATGTMCRVGAIAVDPKVIPYGTRMYIITNDGQYIYGIAVAEDCGGSIKGNRVDLYFDTDTECWAFGVRDCTIYFLG